MVLDMYIWNRERRGLEWHISNQRRDGGLGQSYGTINKKENHRLMWKNP